MKPKQFFWVQIGLIAAVLGAAGTGYYFALTHVQATSQMVATKLADQQEAEKQLQSLERMKNQYNHDIVPILPLIEGALPPVKNQTQILAQLQTIAAESGLTISSITFPSPAGLPTDTSQTVKAGPYLALPVTFAVQGSYAQLQAFLTRIETLSRFTNVNNLAITRPDKTKPITYSLNLNAYVKP
ncbi:MAG TPA: type 4a pilus biogenesis protein PilO [Candidatus Saccharimonas sp.]|nr:type 4a pilus biogenesis protein PilO [Candidatus Saccharimonas sp.]